MKEFFAFVKKEFFHILRDKRTILIVLVMPIIQIILFGFAINNELRNTDVAVIDYSKDKTTERIIRDIDASEYFTVKIQQSNENIDEMFRTGEISGVIIFESKFHENLIASGGAQIQIITDGSDPNSASLVSSYLSAIVMQYQSELISTVQMPLNISVNTKLLYNPQMQSSYNFVPGVMGMILMLICALMTSVAIVREKEKGTMEVLLVSPVKPLYIIFAKTMPYLTLSCINMITVFLISIFILDVPVSGSLFWLIVVSLIFSITALGLGILISTVTEIQVTAMLFSAMGLMVPVMLLSGMIFPIESMPLPLRLLSNIIPATWYISAVKKLMIMGLGVSSILKELGILVFMMSFIYFVSFKKFKTRLE
jgi:ABC-2 type transport system permease protein